MTENCNDKSPLTRDGTSQAERTLAALLPSYAPVDGRSLDDLLAFAQAYAEEIQYWSELDAKQGDWVDFFEGAVVRSDQRTTPHFALFIAFLRLFALIQEDINTLTSRHLDFYYRDVLGLKENPAVADQVAIIFELARRVTSHQVKGETALKAGKDATGVPLVYDTEEDLTVNKATVDEFRAFFVKRPGSSIPFATPEDVWRSFASPIANSADGIGEALENEPPSWRTFGEPTGTLGTFDRPQADLGFAFASPILRMAEGERLIILTLTMNAITGNAPVPTFTPEHFNIRLSATDGWVSPEAGNVTITSNANELTFNIKVAESQEAVIDYDVAVHEGRYDSKYPVLEITLNTEETNYAYAEDAFRTRVLSGADIRVEVDRVRNIVVQNDQSTLNNSKPFLMFGGAPVLGSNFYIGSQEILQKSLDRVEIVLKWSDLPTDDTGFRGYYNGYFPGGFNGTYYNEAFKAYINVLEGKQWLPINAVGEDLFSSQVPQGAVYDGDGIYTSPGPNPRSVTGYPLNQYSTLVINDSALLDNLGRHPEMGDAPSYSVQLQRGFIRLQMTNQDFGHKAYSPALTQVVAKIAKDPDNTANPAIPNTPYNPTVEEIFVNYISSETINPNAVTPIGETRYDQFYHVQPYGVAEFLGANLGEPQVTLLPQYANEGNLFVGLSNMTAPSTVSMLFQVAEGSNNPDLPFVEGDLSFSYLRNNQWVTFDQKQISQESTNGLLTSGIVKLDFPSDATDNNSILPAGKHWLRVAMTKDAASRCNLITVQAQAVLAKFQDNGNDPNHLAVPLPAETIAKLELSDSAVSKVLQPYASFGGKTAETSEAFYTRVSARLRHKQRGITVWDYENLILQNFPEIYKVKCLPHTRYTGSLNGLSEKAPGHVALVIVSNVQNVNSADPLQPRTSLKTLAEIGQYLAPIISPCIDLHVQNPLFEQVKVEFNVKFFDGLDKGFFENKLNEDIIAYLSPWASAEGEDVAFGGKIHQSMILNFIEERSYVDFVSCFKMFQIVQADPLDPGSLIEEQVQEATATTSASILVSFPNHVINLIEVDDCTDCDDNVVVTNVIASVEEDCSCEDESAAKCDGTGIGVMTLRGDVKPFRVG